MVVVNDVETRAVFANGPSTSALFSLLRRPSLLAGLTVLLIAVPGSDHATGVRIATVTPADLGAVVLVGVMGLRVLAGADLQAVRDKLMLPPILMLAAAAVTTVWSTDPTLSLVGVVRYAEIFCLVPLAVVLSVRDTTDVAILLTSVVVLGAGEGALGVYQALTGTGAGYQGETIRAIGTFGVTAQLTMSLVVSCAMVVLLAVALSRGHRWRIPALAGACALVVPLLLGLSRGALLATVVAGVVMLLLTGVRRALATLVIVCVVAVVGVAAVDENGTVAARFTSIGSSATAPDRSVEDRYDLWATALSIWRESPITGVGIKQFPVYRDSHAPLALSSGSELSSTTSYTRGELLSPHNEYLLLLSEQGVLGLGSYALLAVTLFARSLGWPRNRKRASTGAGFDAGRLASLGLFTLFSTVMMYGDLSGGTAVLFALLLGLQLRLAVSDRSPLEAFEGSP